MWAIDCGLFELSDHFGDLEFVSPECKPKPLATLTPESLKGLSSVGFRNFGISKFGIPELLMTRNQGNLHWKLWNNEIQSNCERAFQHFEVQELEKAVIWNREFQTPGSWKAERSRVIKSWRISVIDHVGGEVSRINVEWLFWLVEPLDHFKIFAFWISWRQGVGT
jgi:hypothetical protein